MERLAVSVKSVDGRVTRWAPDAEPERRPHGLRFSTSMPGGFKGLECSLNRERTDGFDLQRFDDVRAYGPGNTTRWEGRQAEFPSQSDELKVSPAAEGWAAHLEDDQTFRMIYADRDLRRWRGPSAGRRLINLASSVDLHDASVEVDVSDGFPSLRLGLVGLWGREVVSESWYDAGPGLNVSAFYYSLRQSASISLADSAWFVGGYSAIADGETGSSFTNETGDLIPGSGSFAANNTYEALAVARRFLMWQLYYPASAGGAGLNYDMFIRKLTVYGNHGLTRRGADPGGFYASDVIPDILARAAPALDYTTGDGGSIQPSDLVIPHLEFRDPASAGAAIQKVNGYHLRQWAVWENRMFHWHDLETRGRVWRPRIGQGARLRMEGEKSEDVWTGVQVRYRDGAGTEQFVGPPGSGLPATSSLLEVTDPANDAVAHGIRRWAVIDLPVITDLPGATQIGNLWLAEANAKRNRGTIVLTGQVTDNHGVTSDVSEVRAGDRVEVPDRDSTTRIVIQTDYDDDQQQVEAALDSTPHTLDALYERLGVSLIGVVE